MGRAAAGVRGGCAATTAGAAFSLGTAARRSTKPVASTSKRPAATNAVQRPTRWTLGDTRLSVRPVSTTGGGVMLGGRARSGIGTWVRVSGGSNGADNGNSPSTSVRSGRSKGTGLGVRLSEVDIFKVVEPSNEGGDTKVVFGTKGKNGLSIVVLKSLGLILLAAHSRKTVVLDWPIAFRLMFSLRTQLPFC